MWSARLAIYLGLFVGIGGAFFRAWIASPAFSAAEPLVVTALVAGLIATPLSVGLQGLDALELPLRGITHAAAWKTGLETAYGLTAIVASSRCSRRCSALRRNLRGWSACSRFAA